MGKFLLRRTLGAIIVIWAVATLVFFMLRMVPGDPFLAMMGDSADPAMAEQLRRAPSFVDVAVLGGAPQCGCIRYLLEAQRRCFEVGAQRPAQRLHRPAQHRLDTAREVRTVLLRELNRTAG